MIKFLSFCVLLVDIALGQGFEQLVVVVSEDMNSTTAKLQRYEKKAQWEKVGENVRVTLGRSGLGYATTSLPQKNEGDGRSPLGLFDIGATFGYSSQSNSSMPYYHADEKLICVDDVGNRFYNKMALLDTNNPPKSFEWMHRTDGVYRYGAVIDYNRQGVAGRGSCIFFHLNSVEKKPTSGCTAMEEKPLLEMLEWLDMTKNPKLLQIPKRECSNYQREFVGIECR
jgi:L,D-peptidoglycan transpeptidase YkuD (ErfK/YbiS/YcfS/YnhG family)